MDRISETSEESDLTTKEARQKLAAMMLRLFGLWQLSIADQANLLGVSQRTIQKYQKGFPLAYRGETKQRIAYLLRIHEALRMLLPYNRDLVYLWVVSINQQFESRPPLEEMKKGIEGLKNVVGYLEWILYH